MSVAVVVLTHNRIELLRRCVENVLARTSAATSEIVVWDNGSDDGTGAYLDALTDPRLNIIHHDENIGMNAYARAFALTSAEYLVDLDDDIIDAPSGWDRTLMDAFERLPDVGFLAANLVDNPHDVTARIMYFSADRYRIEEVNGVSLKLGSVGGGCAMTSRALYDRAGGFRQRKGSVFWLEDEAYINEIQKLGYRAAYLEGLKVLHAGGEYYSKPGAEKLAFWTAYHRSSGRRRAIKRLLLRIPLVRPLNERLGWFTVPRGR
jgi:GT2 family glycosyltransferase